MSALIVTKGRAKYRIDRDPHQFTLEKYSKGKDKKTGEDVELWSNIGYYSDLKYLIRKLVFLHVMDQSKLNDFTKIMTKTCEILSLQIAEALKQGEKE